MQPCPIDTTRQPAPATPQPSTMTPAADKLRLIEGLVRDKRLKPGDVRVGCALLLLLDSVSPGAPGPSRADLARFAKCNQNTATTALRRLAVTGWLTIRRVGPDGSKPRRIYGFGSLPRTRR